MRISTYEQLKLILYQNLHIYLIFLFFIFIFIICCVKKCCQTDKNYEDKEAILNDTSSYKDIDEDSSDVSNSHQLEQAKISRQTTTSNNYLCSAPTYFNKINEKRKPEPLTYSEPETEPELNDDPRVHNLHVMTKNQARAEVKKLYMYYKNKGEGDFTVITGWGRHSKNGEPQIRPAVIEMLQKFDCNYEIQPDNPGRIIIYISPEIDMD